jgi:hypothetical protein
MVGLTIATEYLCVEVGMIFEERGGRREMLDEFWMRGCDSISWHQSTLVREQTNQVAL